MNPTELCLGCMEARGASEVCQSCGWRQGQAADSPLYLPEGTVLQGQYLLGRVLGHGGFGITYLGWDLNLALKLAVKEYLPSNVATRLAGATSVKPYAARTQQDYQWGLEKFLDEARVLARFQKHPGIVSVLNFFRANDSAYLVMEYLEGITLDRHLAEQGGRISAEQAVEFLTPVMNALQEVHKAGILHRDISPDNIHIVASGQVKLLDFGAARYALGQQSRNLSVILKEGFAPEEQYRTKGAQGPWTDVYATAATLYRAITGITPTPALDRLEHDDLVPPGSVPGVTISPRLENCLLKALAVRAPDRYQSMEDFQAALAGREVAAPVAASVAASPAALPGATPLPAPVPQPVPQPLPQPVPGQQPKRSPLAWVLAALGVAALAGGGYMAATRKSAPVTPPASRPPVIRSFQAEPAAVSQGASTTLRWTVDDSSEVTIDPGIGKQAATGVAVVSPAQSTTYILTAKGAAGESVTSSVPVVVNEAAPPGLPEGGATVHNEPTPASRPGPSPAPNRETTVSRNSSGSGPTVPAKGPAPGAGTVPAIPLTIDTFEAQPSSIQAGQPAVLRWSVRGAQRVTILPELGTQELAGERPVSPRVTTTYVLSAVSPADTQSRRVTVVVAAPDLTGQQRIPALSWSVIHDHGGFGDAIKGIAPFGRRSTQGEACIGTLSVENGRLRFQSRTASDSFDRTASGIQDVRMNRIAIGNRRAFHVKLQGGENYNFVPQGDAERVVKAINDALGLGR